MMDLLRAIAVRLLRLLPVLRCDDCGHLFLRYDSRAFVATDLRYVDLDVSCPCCELFNRNDAGDAWALFNDCQGVFVETVRDSRSEAEACLDQSYRDAECYVRAVKVLREPDWRLWRRDADERERSR